MAKKTHIPNPRRPKKPKKPDWNEERRFYFWLGILGAVVAIVYYFIPRETWDVKESELITVNNLVVSQPPKSEKYRSKGGSAERILLHMHGYDKPFQVVRFDLHGNVKENILQYIHEGDTISVKIDSFLHLNYQIG